MARPAGAIAPAGPRESPPPRVVPSKPKSKPKRSDYTSEGVEDNDVFLLPITDYQITLAITALATIVRLFRIYQPTSVVFDEVQYVCPDHLAS